MPIGLLRYIVWISVLCGVVIGALRLTCLRWWQVPTDDPDLAASVAPTLGPGDWVLLWRLTPPGFGDLVLCPDPEDPAEIVIGRVAGEGGDRVQIKGNGDLEVNGVRARSERACKSPSFSVDSPRTGEAVELRCDVETLGGVHHTRALMPSSNPEPLVTDTEVDDGQLFLVSDNRHFPFDSRDFGAVPQQSCGETFIFRLVSRLGFTHVESRLSFIR